MAGYSAILKNPACRLYFVTSDLNCTHTIYKIDLSTYNIHIILGDYKIE